MRISCNSASTKGFDKKKLSNALRHNWTLWYLALQLTHFPKHCDKQRLEKMFPMLKRFTFKW